jgi:hypothetical protein
MLAVVDDPDPYRSMSAIHYSFFKDEYPVVSAHSVASLVGEARRLSFHTDMPASVGPAS